MLLIFPLAGDRKCFLFFAIKNPAGLTLLFAAKSALRGCLLWQREKLRLSLTEFTVVAEADGAGEFHCIFEMILIIERIVSVGTEGQDLAAQIEIAAQDRAAGQPGTGAVLKAGRVDLQPLAIADQQLQDLVDLILYRTVIIERSDVTIQNAEMSGDIEILELLKTFIHVGVEVFQLGRTVGVGEVVPVHVVVSRAVERSDDYIEWIAVYSAAGFFKMSL